MIAWQEALELYSAQNRPADKDQVRKLLTSVSPSDMSLEDDHR